MSLENNNCDSYFSSEGPDVFDIYRCNQPMCNDFCSSNSLRSDTSTKPVVCKYNMNNDNTFYHESFATERYKMSEITDNTTDACNKNKHIDMNRIVNVESTKQVNIPESECNNCNKNSDGSSSNQVMVNQQSSPHNHSAISAKISPPTSLPLGSSPKTPHTDNESIFFYPDPSPQASPRLEEALLSQNSLIFNTTVLYKSELSPPPVTHSSSTPNVLSKKSQSYAAIFSDTPDSSWSQTFPPRRWHKLSSSEEEQQPERYDITIRIILLGDFQVGKTRLLHSLSRYEMYNNIQYKSFCLFYNIAIVSA